MPRSPDSVQVFASAAPTEPFVDVALLEVTQHEGMNRQGLDYMIERLRARAGELGCDAVFIKGMDEHIGDDDRPLAILDPDSTQLFASCLVYVRQPPATTEAQTSSRPPPRQDWRVQE